MSVIFLAALAAITGCGDRPDSLRDCGLRALSVTVIVLCLPKTFVRATLYRDHFLLDSSARLAEGDWNRGRGQSRATVRDISVRSTRHRNLWDRYRRYCPLNADLDQRHQ